MRPWWTPVVVACVSLTVLSGCASTVTGRATAEAGAAAAGTAPTSSPDASPRPSSASDPAAAATTFVRYGTADEEDTAFAALVGGLESWSDSAYHDPLTGTSMSGFTTRIAGWGRDFCSEFDPDDISFALPVGDVDFTLDPADTEVFVAAAVGVFCPDRIVELIPGSGAVELVDGATRCPDSSVISIELNAAESQYRVSNDSEFDAIVVVELNITGDPDGWVVALDSGGFAQRVEAGSSVVNPNLLGLIDPELRVTQDGFLPLRCQGVPGGPTTPASTRTPTTSSTPPTSEPTTTQPAPPAPADSSEPSAVTVTGADGQGFLDVAGARCNADDPAVLIARTDGSAVSICETGAGRFYYRGARTSDGAAIEIDDPEPTGDGFTATNDGTTYELTSSALVITGADGTATVQPVLEVWFR